MKIKKENVILEDQIHKLKINFETIKNDLNKSNLFIEEKLIEIMQLNNKVRLKLIILKHYINL